MKPIKAAVYDAALEWYYGPASIATVSVFYGRSVELRQLRASRPGATSASSTTLSKPTRSPRRLTSADG